jgi:hypothetical protein
MKVRIGDVVTVGSTTEEFVVNRITPAKGRLQIDCIEVEEARRRVRDLKALLELAGIKEEK